MPFRPARADDPGSSPRDSLPRPYRFCPFRLRWPAADVAEHPDAHDHRADARRNRRLPCHSSE